jgi:hypothetical protein
VSLNLFSLILSNPSCAVHHSFTSKNYINTSAPDYTFYVRKHDPTIIYDSVASVPSRLARHRNFNDLAADVNASALPQWLFVTPNMVNDGHDTSIDYTASWLQYWLVPLLNDTNFNDNGTLIVLTFDETETYTVNNRVLTILLGGAVPENLRGTTDSTYYTHYSLLSTVEANWGLGSLGRGDTNKYVSRSLLTLARSTYNPTTSHRTLSNVFSFVANATGYTNVDISGDAIPLTNATGTINGPLNPNQYVPFTAPNTSAVGAGGGSVFVSPGMNTSFTAANAPAPVNLTQQNKTVPASGPRNGSNAGTNNGGNGGSGKKGGAMDMREGIIGATIFGTIVAGVAALLI